MKVTQKQLKQIIREELQQEGFLDSIGDFIKGTNKQYSAFLKQYHAEMQKLSKEYQDAYDAAERGDSEPILDQLGSYDSLAKKNLGFDPKDLSSEQRKQQISVSQKLEKIMQSRSEDLDDINQAAAEEFRKKMEDIRQKRKAEFANRPMVGVLTRAEKEAARKSRKASEREYNKKYDIRTRDAFSESKLTKEDVKQIIREEIKNFKR